MKPTAIALSAHATRTVVRAVTVTLALAASAAHASDKKADEREFNYAQVMGGIVGSSSADVTAGLGNGVSLSGKAKYSTGPAYSLAVGRQMYREKERDGKPTGEWEPWRAELELMSISVKRREIQIAGTTQTPNDRVRTNVLFLNAAMPISESDERSPDNPKEPLWRWWVGAGIGFANSSYAAGAPILNCNCLRAASGSGVAFQVKLQAERQVSENMFVFGQLGGVMLPSTGSGGAASTEYGRRTLLNVGVGIRYAFN